MESIWVKNGVGKRNKFLLTMPLSQSASELLYECSSLSYLTAFANGFISLARRLANLSLQGSFLGTNRLVRTTKKAGSSSGQPGKHSVAGLASPNQTGKFGP
jgi:hypothetical protein